MKKCPQCGQICQDSDAYCEVCGCSLLETRRQSAGKKSPVPILIGCFSVVLILIAATVICIMMFRVKSGEAAEESAVVEQSAEEQIIVEEKVTDSVKNEPSVVIADEPEETTDGSEEKYETMYVVNCHESITLRKSPSTSAGEICQIPFGSPVSYVETAENGFYKIIYNGKTGYGLASYLSTERQENPIPDSSQEQDDIIYMKVVNCRESITLRKTPSTKAEQFCQIPLGAIVEFKGTAENGFYMVSYNGYTGYALASYLTEW